MKPELIWSDSDSGLEIWKLPLDTLKEQDVNAQVMTTEMMERLTTTIARDKRMESIPFGARNGEDFAIISGHHRIRAAKAAGLKETLFLADPSGLNRSQTVAKQLAHNSLVGTTDESIAIRLFEEIDSVEDALESFIEAKSLAAAVSEDEVSVEMSDEENEDDTRVVILAFLDKDVKTFERVLTRIDGSTDIVGAVDRDQYELFQHALSKVGHKIKVTNAGAIVAEMCRIVLRSTNAE